LVREHGVRFVWLADEFFSADKEVARQAMEQIKQRDLGISMNLNMTARSVIENADNLALYRDAGVAHVVVGVESVRDNVVAKIGKDNPFAVSKQAIRLLADHGIVSTASMVFGLEDESVSKMGRTLVSLYQLDPDIFNACYATPLPGTSFTKTSGGTEEIAEPDISKWTYRTPVVAMRGLPVWLLFWLVKFCEVAFHLRPRALKRLILGRRHGGAPFRMVFRGHYRAGAWVLLDEVLRFIRTRRPRLSEKRESSPRPRELCMGPNPHETSPRAP